MRILVLVTNYPTNDGGTSLMYVHVRNKYYKNREIDVTVLNFSAKENYVIDNIPVISLASYDQNSNIKYDILISHAPNIRNHYRFLKKYEKKFKKLVFIFHGHEVVRIKKSYPKPYEFKKSSLLYGELRDIYDIIKLKLWRNYYTKLSNKSHFIFVSEWLFKEFLYYIKIDKKVIKDRYQIINNSVGQVFQNEDYDINCDKIYDFITIRAGLDRSTYSVDIVNQLAENNQKLRFIIVGKGNFFSYNKKAQNVTWLNRKLKHNEIIHLLNQSRCALMPTRWDTQGVMSCEMATFGIPLITSDIPVCHEIFDGFKNICLIDNYNLKINLSPILEELQSKLPYYKNDKYFAENTSEAEAKLFKSFLED